MQKIVLLALPVTAFFLLDLGASFVAFAESIPLTARTASTDKAPVREQVVAQRKNNQTSVLLIGWDYTGHCGTGPGTPCPSCGGSSNICGTALPFCSDPTNLNYGNSYSDCCAVDSFNCPTGIGTCVGNCKNCCGG
jgi:hypothetical protein